MVHLIRPPIDRLFSECDLKPRNTAEESQTHALETGCHAQWKGTRERRREANPCCGLARIGRGPATAALGTLSETVVRKVVKQGVISLPIHCFTAECFMSFSLNLLDTLKIYSFMHSGGRASGKPVPWNGRQRGIFGSRNAEQHTRERQ